MKLSSVPGYNYLRRRFNRITVYIIGICVVVFIIASAVGFSLYFVYRHPKPVVSPPTTSPTSIAGTTTLPASTSTLPQVNAPTTVSVFPATTAVPRTETPTPTTQAAQPPVIVVTPAPSPVTAPATSPSTAPTTTAPTTTAPTTTVAPTTTTTACVANVLGIRVCS